MCINCQAKATTIPQTAVKCPVCDGAGHVSRPPWVPGDMTTWASSSTQTYPCHACGGLGLLTTITRQG